MSGMSGGAGVCALIWKVAFLFLLVMLEVGQREMNQGRSRQRKRGGRDGSLKLRHSWRRGRVERTTTASKLRQEGGLRFVMCLTCWKSRPPSCRSLDAVVVLSTRPRLQEC